MLPSILRNKAELETRSFLKPQWGDRDMMQLLRTATELGYAFNFICGLALASATKEI